MKILHIASFKGNVGDIINHNGFYYKMKLKETDVKKIEIRDFYFSCKCRKKFDEEFAEIINEFDLLLLGGGGFFDLQWEGSMTGTTLDFSKKFIDRIRVPVIVNAMGYHEYPNKTTKELCFRFEKFLNLICEKENWLISLRNDGSFDRIRQRYGEEIIKKILKVPDNGFFCDFSKLKLREKEDRVIGICISNDLFTREYNGEITIDKFNDLMKNYVNYLTMHGFKLIFFPHTPNDIVVISEILNKGVLTKSKREDIIIAPFDATSRYSVDNVAAFYSWCDCVIGMRFHSLITAINLGIPAICLSPHQQIESLFYELGLEKFIVKVNSENFIQNLNDVLGLVRKDKKKILQQYKDIYSELNDANKNYIFKVSKFLNSMCE